MVVARTLANRRRWGLQEDVISQWWWHGPWQIADVGGCTSTLSHHGDGMDLSKLREVGGARGRHLTMGMARTLANRGR